MIPQIWDSEIFVRISANTEPCCIKHHCSTVCEEPNLTTVHSEVNALLSSHSEPAELFNE